MTQQIEYLNILSMLNIEYMQHLNIYVYTYVQIQHIKCLLELDPRENSHCRGSD